MKKAIFALFGLFDLAQTSGDLYNEFPDNMEIYMNSPVETNYFIFNDGSSCMSYTETSRIGRNQLWKLNKVVNKDYYTLNAMDNGQFIYMDGSEIKCAHHDTT